MSGEHENNPAYLPKLPFEASFHGVGSEEWLRSPLASFTAILYSGWRRLRGRAIDQSNDGWKNENPQRGCFRVTFLHVFEISIEKKNVADLSCAQFLPGGPPRGEGFV